MARTVSEGLRTIADTDLSRLLGQFAELRAEAATPMLVKTVATPPPAEAAPSEAALSKEAQAALARLAGALMQMTDALDAAARDHDTLTALIKELKDQIKAMNRAMEKLANLKQEDIDVNKMMVELERAKTRT